MGGTVSLLSINFNGLVAGPEQGATGTILPTDNPSYGANGGLNSTQDSAGYQVIPALSNNSNVRTENPADSLQERDFNNPIYGSEVVQEHNFDNPIYGGDHSATHVEEPEDHYTIPNSPPCNVYDRVAGDHPLGGARVGTVNTNGEDSDGGVYSTVPT